ncbi:hypothetical protein CPB83DRAFT_780609 [Crepidotus variabilis]|uniref:Uncharacterized protein n=1 Tax=Crepidotus variabilis TaxID=179855 RepID=A0A9P6ERJ6_9AGAR|nr:hypothetical protein CPB83DRAFT_780609 [Crepidotus variabilis]
MTTSELSDALNPYASSRKRQTVAEYSPQVQHAAYRPVVQPPQQYVPHVSELQMAITEPPPPPPPPARPSQGAQIVGQILGMIHATQQAHEEERQRRLAWEQEQETRNSQRQAEMEEKMLEMLDELQALRSTMNAMNTPSTTPTLAVVTAPQNPDSPLLSQPAVMSPAFQPVTPTSPVPQTVSYSEPELYSAQTHPIFVEGSSNDSLPTPVTPAQIPESPSPGQPTPRPITKHSFRVTVAQPLYTLTPDPSPLLANANISDLPSNSQSSRASKRKKKRTPEPSSDEDDSSSSSSSSVVNRPRKRRSHHDTRIYTIHHAMRQHLLRMMEVENDKHLPDSLPPDSQPGPYDPVRFVWDKTTKQSIPNNQMKKRVIADIKENRNLYKHVSSKDFGKKQLDAAFEQCFVTFRQKFKVQRDAASAMNYKQREEMKARKARHISRRKLKLTNRSEARNNMSEYEHVIFDGAFQQDCMSSEESDVEQDPQTLEKIPILRSRGYSWRSSRLMSFYDILDEEERVESSTKPQRGVGRRERRVGSPRERFILPPEGVSSWMISKRWLKVSQANHPDLPATMSKLIVDPPGFDWTAFDNLGDESAEEEEYNPTPEHNPLVHEQQPFQHAPPPAPQNIYDAGMRHMDMSLPQLEYTNTPVFINYNL